MKWGNKEFLFIFGLLINFVICTKDENAIKKIPRAIVSTPLDPDFFSKFLSRISQTRIFHAINAVSIYEYNYTLEHEVVIPYIRHLSFVTKFNSREKSIIDRMSISQKKVLLVGAGGEIPLCQASILRNQMSNNIIEYFIKRVHYDIPVHFYCPAHSNYPFKSIFQILLHQFNHVWKAHIKVNSSGKTSLNGLFIRLVNSEFAYSHEDDNVYYQSLLSYKHVQSLQLISRAKVYPSVYTQFLIPLVFRCSLKEMTRYLKEGMKFSIREPHTGLTPLHYIALEGDNEKLDALRNSKEWPSSVLMSDYSGNDAAMFLLKNSGYLKTLNPNRIDSRLAFLLRFIRLVQKQKKRITRNKENKDIIHYAIDLEVLPVLDLVLENIPLESTDEIEYLEYAVDTNKFSAVHHILLKMDHSKLASSIPSSLQKRIPLLNKKNVLKDTVVLH